jgi:hypothetical protein
MIKKRQLSNNNFTEFLLYSTPDGKVKFEVYLKDETVWLTQTKLAELFDVNRPAITKHLINIFKTNELVENSVSSILEHTAVDGKKYQTKYYNLDAIIAVGYRVNSRRATQFRIWATERLKEYIVKGFTMDDERLKDPAHIFGKDYFEEQLARIRNIRSSERRLYQKITDIYSQCSADYNPDMKITTEFFATVQNKLHYAITGKTAAEIVFERVSNSKPNLGLTSWKNGPSGQIRETDVIIAKNFLNETELDNLNRIVTMYLDYADMQAKNHKVMYMKDWVKKLNAFLAFNEEEILHDNGKVSHEVAAELALGEYKKYLANEDKNYISDFDREVSKMPTSSQRLPYSTQKKKQSTPRSR